MGPLRSIRGLRELRGFRIVAGTHGSRRLGFSWAVPAVQTICEPGITEGITVQSLES